eukprot:9838371-Alexandrium_andersonii.AAC.1
MSASLVGSEMCIRDSPARVCTRASASCAARTMRAARAHAAQSARGTPRRQRTRTLAASQLRRPCSPVRKRRVQACACPR